MVFSYSCIVTLLEYREIFYGSTVKCVCSKKLSVTQRIYLGNGEDKQWIKERKITVFLTFIFEKVKQKALCTVVKPKCLWHCMDLNILNLGPWI